MEENRERCTHKRTIAYRCSERVMTGNAQDLLILRLFLCPCCCTGRLCYTQSRRTGSGGSLLRHSVTRGSVGVSGPRTTATTAASVASMCSCCRCGDARRQWCGGRSRGNVLSKGRWPCGCVVTSARVSSVSMCSVGVCGVVILCEAVAVTVGVQTAAGRYTTDSLRCHITTTSTTTTTTTGTTSSSGTVIISISTAHLYKALRSGDSAHQTGICACCTDLWRVRCMHRTTSASGSSVGGSCVGISIWSVVGATVVSSGSAGYSM